jgi:hypothetical protein
MPAPVVAAPALLAASGSLGTSAASRLTDQAARARTVAETDRAVEAARESGERRGPAFPWSCSWRAAPGRKRGESL